MLFELELSGISFKKSKLKSSVFDPIDGVLPPPPCDEGCDGVVLLWVDGVFLPPPTDAGVLLLGCDIGEGTGPP